MNILYCGDKNIKDGLFISIISLLKNVKDIVNIYVLTINIEVGDKKIQGLDDETISFLDRYVKEYNKLNFVKLIDITKIFEKNIPYINLNTRFTPCCMLRLFADQIEELPDKILYLDNDVVIRSDIGEFYNLDISEVELAGVFDYYGRWLFDKDYFIKSNYLNSGVLLLNLKEIRKTRLFLSCINLCKNKKMFMPDQSAINKLVKRKKVVPRKYNEQRKLKKDTVIQHFTTSFRFFPYFKIVSVKPWQIDKMHNVLKLHEYDDILRSYEDEKRNTNIFNN